MYWLHLTKFRYLDFAAVLTFNHLPKGFLESLFAEVVVLIFLGVLGIGFSMLIKVISSKNIYFKGWLYGTFMWFAIYATMTMYELKHIYPVDTMTAFLKLNFRLIMVNRNDLDTFIFKKEIWRTELIKLGELQHMPTNDDHFLLWAISGIIGVLSRDVYSTIAKLIGFAKFYVWDIGADIFIEPKQVHTILGTIVGFLTDFVTGSFLGVIFGCLLNGKELNTI